MDRPSARDVFGERSSRYVSSATHADPAVLSQVVEQARVDSSSRALDIGTGTGHTAFALASLGATVVGFDITPQMLDRARENRPDDTAKLSFVQGDAHSLPFRSMSADAVTCRRTAHHFGDIGRAIAEMDRVLVPGGRLVIDDRSIPEDDGVDDLINRLDTIHDPSHIREYRLSEWRTMLEAAGFTIVHDRSYTQHRAVAEHTSSLPADAAEQIRKCLAEAPGDLQERINYVDDAYTHWFVTVAAEKPA